MEVWLTRRSGTDTDLIGEPDRPAAHSVTLRGASAVVSPDDEWHPTIRSVEE